MADLYLRLKFCMEIGDYEMQLVPNRLKTPSI